MNCIQGQAVSAENDRGFGHEVLDLVSAGAFDTRRQTMPASRFVSN